MKGVINLEECLTCKPKEESLCPCCSEIGFNDELAKTYDTIRKIHGTPEVSLGDFMEEVKDAIAREDGPLIHSLLFNFMFADDGARTIT